MSARILDYYDYDEKAKIQCPNCDWSGPGSSGGMEIHSELFDVSCPRCRTMLLIVGYPTIEETKAAAEVGNPAALADMDQALMVEGFRERWHASKLKEVSDLPDIEGDGRFDLAWDMRADDDGGDHLTVIRQGERVIWTEVAAYEGIDRFFEVLRLLRERYGNRLRFLLPTPSSEVYLYGDKLSAPDRLVASQLPPVDGEQLEFQVAYERDELGGPDLRIKCGEELVWRELGEPQSPAIWRVRALESQLRRKYGDAFAGLRFAPGSEALLFGAEFPELDGPRLDFEWDLVIGEDLWRHPVLLYEGREIWRDASHDAAQRPELLERLLREVYGERVGALSRRAPGGPSVDSSAGESETERLLARPAAEITEPRELIRRVAERDYRMSHGAQTRARGLDIELLRATNNTDLKRLMQLVTGLANKNDQHWPR
jgi:hypothetical protein